MQQELDILKSLYDILKSSECKASEDVAIVRGLHSIINEKWITIKPHGKSNSSYLRIKLYDGESAKDGVKRVARQNEIKRILQQKDVKPMTRRQACSAVINLHFGRKDGGLNNCQSCVIAFEARLRGYNIRSKLRTPSDEAMKELSKDITIAWIDRKTGKQPQQTVEGFENASECYDWLHNTVKKGCRYLLGYKPSNSRDGVGHIVNLDKDDNGNLRIYDAQTNKSILDNVRVFELLQQVQYKQSDDTYYPIKLLRIDNLDFDIDFVSSVIDKV